MEASYGIRLQDNRTQNTESEKIEGDYPGEAGGSP